MVRPESHAFGVAQCGDRQAPHNLEKAVVKVSRILGGTVILLTLTLAAREGVGDAQRGAQVFNQCKICHSLDAGKLCLARAYMASSDAKQAASPALPTRRR